LGALLARVLLCNLCTLFSERFLSNAGIQRSYGHYRTQQHKENNHEAYAVGAPDKNSVAAHGQRLSHRIKIHN